MDPWEYPEINGGILCRNIFVYHIFFATLPLFANVKCSTVYTWHVACACLGCAYVFLYVCPSVCIHAHQYVCLHVCCHYLHLLESSTASYEPGSSTSLSLRPGVALYNDSQDHVVSKRLNLEHSRGSWCTHTVNFSIVFLPSYILRLCWLNFRLMKFIHSLLFQWHYVQEFKKMWGYLLGNTQCC